MKRLSLSVTAAGVALAAATATPARAGVEIGGTAGLRTFSKDGALGIVNPDSPNGADGLRNSALFGLRVSVLFTPMFGVELEGGFIPTEPRSLLFDVSSITYRAQFIAQLRANVEENHFLPFAVLGAGMTQIINTDRSEIVEKDSAFAPYIGLGVKYRTNTGWGVRLDGRFLLSKGDDRPMNEDDQASFAPEFEALISVYREFGRDKKKEIVVEPPPPPPVDEDPDKDGVVGAADQCPTDPEDVDSFEDENGCPDPDNDQDGIADASDQCALEAEDKDNFEDENGCPDPDNDADGVPDAADQCPLEAETKNGFEDDNGCPDEIPEKLKQFTGVIQGINFKSGLADLEKSSSKTLDKAVAVLQEFATARLEIQGHTDDAAPKKGGKFADNEALSQARAETVKAYFVSKGIAEDRVTAKGYASSAPVEDPTGLKGGKLKSARAKNRRVEFKLITDAGAPAP